MVQLYDVISNGYKNGYKNKKIDGFELDPSLSNENNQLYVNKKDKKINQIKRFLSTSQFVI